MLLFSLSVVSSSLWPMDCRLPTRPHCPWDFLGKNTAVGCHFLFQGIFPTQDWTSISYIAGRCLVRRDAVEGRAADAEVEGTLEANAALLGMPLGPEPAFWEPCHPGAGSLFSVEFKVRPECWGWFCVFAFWGWGWLDCWAAPCAHPGHVPRGQRPYLVTMDSEPGERVDVRLKLLNGSVGRGWVGLLLASWHHCFIGSVLLEMESRLRKLVKLDVSEAGCALAEPQRECVCVRVCAQSCPTLRPHGL